MHVKLPGVPKTHLVSRILYKPLRLASISHPQRPRPPFTGSIHLDCIYVPPLTCNPGPSLVNEIRNTRAPSNYVWGIELWLQKFLSLNLPCLLNQVRASLTEDVGCRHRMCAGDERLCELHDQH
jgi:hypothetical protein